MNNSRKKENNKAENTTISLQKNLNSANATPIAYKHTEKFIEDGRDPLNAEREHLKNNKVDWLLREKRIPAIEADTYLEIEAGKRQFTNHISSCRQIIEIESGELQCVNDMKEIVQKELAGYEKLYDELLQKSKMQLER